MPTESPTVYGEQFEAVLSGNSPVVYGEQFEANPKGNSPVVYGEQFELDNYAEVLPPDPSGGGETSYVFAG